MQTTDQSEAAAQHCLCTGLMWDLLTFPIGAVNLCLSMHLRDWLSVWSEQLPAKCVCQLRQSPLCLCCPKKIKRKTPAYPTPAIAPWNTPTKTPQSSPLHPISLLPTSSFPFSHDSSAGKPTINDFFRRPSVWDMACREHSFHEGDKSLRKKERKKNDLHFSIMCSCAQLIKELQGCHFLLKT